MFYLVYLIHFLMFPLDSFKMLFSRNFVFINAFYFKTMYYKTILKQYNQ